MLTLMMPLLALALFLAGCPKRPGTSIVSAPPPGASPPTAAAPASTPGPGIARPAGPALGGPSTARGTATPPRPAEFTISQHLADVHFDFDRYDIRPADARTLDANAGWLKKNDGLILIEGHCDERGTNEYNLALGERRAQAAMNYLVAQGVSAARISTISYGKERPVCAGHDEGCWARNRRAHFLVKTR
jgi:peptidoglycan-associated lipoprotein